MIKNKANLFSQFPAEDVNRMERRRRGVQLSCRYSRMPIFRLQIPRDSGTGIESDLYVNPGLYSPNFIQIALVVMASLNNQHPNILSYL